MELAMQTLEVQSSGARERAPIHGIQGNIVAAISTVEYDGPQTGRRRPAGE